MRFALLVGNQKYYPGAYLSTPINDVHKLKRKLQKMKFIVLVFTDLTKDEFEEKVRDWIYDIEEEYSKDILKICLFFYSGHGKKKKIINKYKYIYINIYI